METRFKEYCELYGEVPSTETIRKTLQELVNYNAIQSIGRGKYMVNPLIAGGENKNDRRVFINEYSAHLLHKGKNAMTDFYPRYQKRNK